MTGVLFLEKSNPRHVKRLAQKEFPAASKSANDNINIALIGAGLMGQGDLNTALQHDGVEMVAAFDLYDHFGFFFDAIRNGTPLTQNGTFGLRGCGSALLTNISYRENKIVNRNPQTMEIA